LNVRIGKNAYWVPYHNGSGEWRERLCQVLSDIIDAWRSY